MGNRTLSLVVVIVLGGCTQNSPSAEDTTTTRRRDLKSRSVEITVAEPESAPVLAAIEAAFVEMERLATILADKGKDSQIAKVNKSAGQAPVAVGDEVFEVARLAHQISRERTRAFDISSCAL